MRKRPTPTRDGLQTKPDPETFDATVRSPSKKRGLTAAGASTSAGGGGSGAVGGPSAPASSAAGSSDDAATPLVAADTAGECNVQ